jgi:chemotaxis protein MotB
MNIMMRWAVVSIIGFGMTGCVTKSTYLKQVQTADQLSKDKSVLEKEKGDLAGQLLTVEQQRLALEEKLAASKKENSDLFASLDAKSGELSKRIADLSREKQDLARQLQETEEARVAEVNKVKGTYEQLVGNLKDQINAGQVQITQLAGRLSVNMVDKILFNSGEASVKPEGEKVLLQVGAALKNVQDKAIRVEGHTDNVPIASSLQSRFASNWELSTARATAVVRYLQDKAGIAPDHLIAAGYGEYKPIAPNTTPEGRAQNRRIEIVLVPVEGVAVSTGTVK